MKAVFDTNILIDFLRGRREAREELARFDDRSISVVTWMEVMVGAEEETVDGTRAWLDDFEVLDVTQAVAEEAVRLRKRHRVKLPDAIIWASARSIGAMLVTRDRRDFPADDPGVRRPYP